MTFAIRDAQPWLTRLKRPMTAVSANRTVASLIVAAIIPLLLFGAAAAFLAAEENRQAARLDVTNTLERVVDRVTVAVQKEVELAEALASLPSLDAPDLDRFYRTAQRIAPKRPLWETVSIANVSGSQVMNILRRLGDPLGPVSDRAGFDEAIRTMKPVIGGIGPVGPVSGKRLVSISVPVIRDGVVRHVLVVGLAPLEIQNILMKAGPPKDWLGAIVDANGNIIARSQDRTDLGKPASNAVRSAIANAPSGEYNSETPAGVAVDTLYRRLPATNGWTVHFGIPSATLNGPVSQTTMLLVASCAVCLLLAAGLAHAAARDLEERRLNAERYADLLLTSSEARAAVAVEAAALGAWRYDRRTRVFSGSARTKDILALPDEALNDKDWVWPADRLLSCAHPDDRERLSEVLQDAAASDAQINFEFRARTHAGHRWVKLAGRSMPSFDDGSRTANSFVLQGVVADIHDARNAQAERAALQKKLADAQEDEQRRIARELHDQIGQTLTGLSLGLKSLEPEMQSEQLRSRIAWLKSLTSDISRDIHRIAADLRPVALDDLGLARALSALAAELSRRHEITFDVQCLGLAKRMPASVENAAYRIVQEAFTNVLKHANARTASAILEKTGASLRIIVEDDGVGLPSSAEQDDANALGLFSIKERLATLNGRLRIESTPGHGLSLYMDIPLTYDLERT